LIKVIHKKAEDAKISIRQVRQNWKSKIEKIWKNKEISEDEVRDSESDLQKIINDKIWIIDELMKHKEEAIKTV
jgi:ribosome recycling factor